MFCFRLNFMSRTKFYMIMLIAHATKRSPVHYNHYHIDVNLKQKIQPLTKSSVGEKILKLNFLAPIDFILSDCSPIALLTADETKYCLIHCTRHLVGISPQQRVQQKSEHSIGDKKHSYGDKIRGLNFLSPIEFQVSDRLSYGNAYNGRHKKFCWSL